MRRDIGSETVVLRSMRLRMLSSNETAVVVFSEGPEAAETLVSMIMTFPAAGGSITVSGHKIRLQEFKVREGAEALGVKSTIRSTQDPCEPPSLASVELEDELMKPESSWLGKKVPEIMGGGDSRPSGKGRAA